MRVRAEVPPSELALEHAFRHAQLKRNRTIALAILALCTLGAVGYYALVVVPLLSQPDDAIIRVELTWAGWLKVAWLTVVLAVGALVNLGRAIAITREMAELDPGTTP